jgi:hypothetical protein
MNDGHPFLREMVVMRDLLSAGFRDGDHIAGILAAKAAPFDPEQNPMERVQPKRHPFPQVGMSSALDEPFAMSAATRPMDVLPQCAIDAKHKIAGLIPDDAGAGQGKAQFARKGETGEDRHAMKPDSRAFELGIPAISKHVHLVTGTLEIKDQAGGVALGAAARHEAMFDDADLHRFEAARAEHRLAVFAVRDIRPAPSTQQEKTKRRNQGR